MKKILLITFVIFSQLAFGQNNSPQYNSTTKKTTQYTGVVPKAPVWSATDTSSGKSSIFKFETGRIKFKNSIIATDTAGFDRVLVTKGDSLKFVSKSLIAAGGSAIDTTKVGRIEQGRGTAPIFMYFNGVAWVRNDTSYVPQSGTNKFSGNLLSNQSFLQLGLGSSNNNLTFTDEVFTGIKSASATSETQINAYSTTNGYADISVYNPLGGLYDRRMVITGTGNNTPDQSFRIQNGLLYYFGNYTSQMTDDRTVPDIGKVKQLISDSLSSGGGGSSDTTLSQLRDVRLTSLANKNILIYNTAPAKWRNKALSGDGIIDTTGILTNTGLNNVQFSSLGTGLHWNTTGTGIPTIATSPQILSQIALNSGNIVVGNASNQPQAQTLSLNATGGSFGLSNAGVLTMPDATATSKGLVTSADYKKYLASDVGGVLFIDNFTRADNASLGANYTQSGSTMSILSNKLRMTNAAGSLSWTSNSAKVTGISPSNLENFEVSATATIPTLSSTTFGASIGFESTTLPTYGQSFEVRFAMETANQGKILFYNTQSLINLNKATGSLTISSGNTTAIKVVVNKNEIIATWTNTTTNTSLTQSFVFELGRTTAVKAIMANTHYVTLFSHGGTIDIDDLTITSTTKKGGIWKIGDSITMGYSAGDISKRAVDVLSKNYVGNFTAFGAGNLRIEELTSCAALIATHLPEEIIFSGGVNNIRFGESASTIAGRIATFLTTINSLTSNYYIVGVNFFVESLVPQALQDVSATNALLASTYTTGYIDAFSPLRYNSASTPNTAYYNVDGIHPNAIGFQEEAKTIALKRGYTLRNQTDINNYSVRAQSNGYVGIGDVTPQTSLDVVGPKSLIRMSNTTSSATDNGLYAMCLTGAGNIGYNVYYDSTNFIAKGTTTSSITFGGNALRFFADTGASIGSSVSQTQKMTITRSGVGIGNTSPTYSLDIVNSASQIRLASTSTDNVSCGFIRGITSGIIIGSAPFDGTNYRARSTSETFISSRTNGVEFFANSSLTAGNTFTPTSRMFMDLNGNVGIGITTPTAKLHVSTNGQSLNSIFTSASVVDAILYSGTKRLVHKMVVSNDTALVRPLINFQRTRGSNTSPTSVTDGTYLGSISAAAYDGTSIFGGTDITSIVNGTVSTGVVPSDMVFSTTATNTLIERMRINSTGNVGIGIASPTAQLHVSTNGQTLSSVFTPYSVVLPINYSSSKILLSRIIVSNDTSGRRGLHYIYRTRGSNTTPTTVANADLLGDYRIAGFDGTTVIDGIGMSGVVNGTVSTGVVPSDMVFSTTATNTLIERMRINSTGNVGIGTSSPTSTLNVSGSFALAYVAKTGTYTATANDYLVDCTSGTFTVTLPTAVGITGRIYEIVNSGAGTITVATTSSQTFTNVTANPTTLSLITGQGKSIKVMSNGANWIQLN